jgi:hypothetical protein
VRQDEVTRKRLLKISAAKEKGWQAKQEQALKKVRRRAAKAKAKAHLVRTKPAANVSVGTS